LNATTRKDHFPLPFIDQMVERLALMQKAKVRSSAGCTFVRKEATIWQALQVRSNVALHRVLSGACARTQTRNERSQVCERSGIGGSAFDRKYYVRTNCRRLIFPETELN
jgi:hypothetical protein